MTTMRLFFALQPEPAQRAAIAAATLATAQAMGAKPVAQADLHMTLAFLGEVATESLPGLLRATDGISSGPVQLSLTRLDCWAGSRVLCVLPEESAQVPLLQQLAASLGDAARAAGLAPDTKPFRAHVTVARKVPAPALRTHHWPELLSPPLPFTASGFVLMESTRDPEGPRYKVIHVWPPPRRDV